MKTFKLYVNALCKALCLLLRECTDQHMGLPNMERNSEGKTVETLAQPLVCLAQSSLNLDVTTQRIKTQ